MVITKIRHAWPEKKGFFLERPDGAGEYIFLHFWQPMHLLSQGKIVVTKPNAVVLFAPHTPQKFFNRTQDIVHDWMHITGNVDEVLARYGLCAGQVYYPEASRFITELVGEMETEFFSQGPYYDTLLELKLQELFVKLSRQLAPGRTKTVLDPSMTEQLKQLRQEMFSCLEDAVSVPEMARRLGVSESRFYVLYKALFGVPPATDLIYARMERAKFLLAQKAHSVSETAKMVGYANEYHFIRQFKKWTGVTPGKFHM